MPMTKTKSQMDKETMETADTEAKDKMEVANRLKAVKDKELEEKMREINDEKKQKQVFYAKLNKYNKPVCNVIVGFTFSACIGLLSPMTGTLFMLTITGMYTAVDGVFDAIKIYLLGLCGIAIGMFVFRAVNDAVFRVVSENITINIRKDLYLSILMKHIGWHDDRENSSGVMSSMLASDVQLLNGASSQAAATTAEAACALLWSVLLGFIFSWPISVVFIFLLPLLMIGAGLQARQDAKGF